jgi:hypothetical protein
LSITPNAITELLPATYVAADFLSALHSHIDLVSANMDIDIIAAGGASDGFVFQSVTDPGVQYILRRTGAATIAMSIEPAQTVTVVGTTVDPPTGTGADWSSERTYTIGTLGAGSKVWLTEHDDAVTLLTKSAAGTSWQPGFHIGRIFKPSYPNIDEPLGNDGLGFLYGAPFFTSSPANVFLGNSSTVLPNTNTGLVHAGTGFWTTPIGSGSYIQSLEADSITYAPYIRPGPIGISVAIRSNYVNYVEWGQLKYLVRGGTARDPLQRVDVNNASELAFIAGGVTGSIASSNNCLLIPWWKSVTP